MTGPTMPPGDGYADADERNWAILTHVLAAVGCFFAGVLGWVMPLITYLTRAQRSPTLRAHAVGALNFNITWAVIDLVAAIIGNCLGRFGVPLLPWLLSLIIVIPIVFNVIAAVRASQGQVYRHPLSYPLLK